mgnify:CR=1 FL=1
MISQAPISFRFRPLPTIPDLLKKEYGSGLAFPLSFEKNKCRVSDREEKIQRSIFTILVTPVGVSLPQLDFGSLLPHLVMQRYTSQLKRELIKYTREALDRWETRIVLGRVDIDDSDISNNVIRIYMEYTIKGTSSSGNYVLPLILEKSPGFSAAGDFTLGGRKVFQ